MGVLPECVPGGKYQLMFGTVEADPSVTPKAGKDMLSACLNGFNPSRKCVAHEISETGYAHYHFVLWWPKPQRFTMMVKAVKKRMHYVKENGTGISVRVFHPRGGAEAWPDMMSYVTEKKHKISEGDGELIVVDNRVCPLCIEDKIEPPTLMKWGTYSAFKRKHWYCPLFIHHGDAAAKRRSERFIDACANACEQRAKDTEAARIARINREGTEHWDDDECDVMEYESEGEMSRSE